MEQLVETGFKKEMILMLQVWGEWEFTANTFLLMLVVNASWNWERTEDCLALMEIVTNDDNLLHTWILFLLLKWD